MNYLSELNEQQRCAVQHGSQPLLILAGAGTGKTRTLVHRVAHLVEQGVPPGRILLLTFTRRAASEMLRRVDALLRDLGRAEAISHEIWGGTFHAVAARLLRVYGKSIGVDPRFSILDRSDSEDLMQVVRADLNLDKTTKRFPKKGTCLAIYSHCVNGQLPVDEVIGERFSWCDGWINELKELFRSYVDRKEQAAALDYDDLLLFFNCLLADPASGQKLRGRFDGVLVDEYQDTNALQATILRQLCPTGAGLTAVGDDAQSIYSFRAATVRNILDFPEQFAGTTILKLEQNYRSTQPILQATNDIIAQASQRFAKQLWTGRSGGARPQVLTCGNEQDQADAVITRILEHRESGIELHQQAVLFRASYHSLLLEGELLRRKIPFVKYGGLKFMETAHVKDLMAFLRLAENPRDYVAGARILQLLPGVGARRAAALMKELLAAAGDFAAWSTSRVPPACRETWPRLVRLLQQLSAADAGTLPQQVHAVRAFYGPLLEERYDRAEPRLRDLEQMEVLAARFSQRRMMIADVALDPPESSEDFAGALQLDDDYLVLSTIHSAKGLEWTVVYTIHASDGNIPADLSTGSTEKVDEELRLFYVAVTRAKDWLYVSHPLKYHYAHRGPRADRYGFAQLTRFMPDQVLQHFDRVCCDTETWEAELEEADFPRRRRSAREDSKSLFD